MRALDRKLLRDLRRTAPQLAAVTLVTACGVAMIVMSWSMLRSLDATRERYYAEARFGDLFVHLERAPDVVGRRLAALPGVDRLQTRVVEDVTIRVGGPDRDPPPTTGRFVSLPEAEGLHALHVLRGRRPEPARPPEALVSEGFASARSIRPGDRIEAVLNGRLTPIDVVGIATSPEFVYTIRPGSPFPDDRSFGVLWMEKRILAAAFDMNDAFNDVVLTLAPGARPADVCRAIDAELDRYGGMAASGRIDQPSHRYLDNELRELRNMGLMAPLIFLAVAAILMHLILSRLVAAQREQIATLTAFGYRPSALGWHYVKLAAIVVGGGSILGIAVGFRLGEALTRMYAGFFHFPVLRFVPDPGVCVLAGLVATVAAVLGILRPLAGVLDLAPAAAMLPRPPSRFRPALLERIGMAARAPVTLRMVMRHLEQRPLVTLLSTLGIALGVAVMVLGMFVGDAVTLLGDFQFTVVERHHRAVTFDRPIAGSAIGDLGRIPGVTRVEPLRTVGAVIRFGHRRRRQEIVGLSPGGALLRIVDRDGRIHEPREDGLVTSAKLAEILGATVGDTIDVEVLEFRRPRVRLVLVGTVDDMVGTSAYLAIGAMHRLLGEDDAVNGALLAIDGITPGAVDRALAAAPRVAASLSREERLRTFRETIARTLLRMRSVNGVFAVLIACGVVATTTRQSLTERSRDLASLRVLGFTRGEVAGILLGEQAILVLAAIPTGLLLGAGFVIVTTWGYDSDLFRVPVVLGRRTLAIAAATVLLAALATAAFARRALDRIDLVTVLKARD